MKETFLVIAALVVIGMGMYEPDYQYSTVSHKVKGNETFWEIAEQYYDKQDRYRFGEFVYAIRDANGGESKQIIQPNETIVIPLYKK